MLKAYRGTFGGDTSEMKKYKQDLAAEFGV